VAKTNSKQLFSHRNPPRTPILPIDKYDTCVGTDVGASRTVKPFLGGRRARADGSKGGETISDSNEEREEERVVFCRRVVVVVVVVVTVPVLADPVGSPSPPDFRPRNPSRLHAITLPVPPAPADRRMRVNLAVPAKHAVLLFSFNCYPAGARPHTSSSSSSITNILRTYDVRLVWFSINNYII